jgi:16S rRNA (adenine1518-N6/adenine1519-N6)-dimethyltransferase
MPTPSSRNQTLSFLMKRFTETGIRPRTNIGQNFLIDLNLLRLLLRSAQLGPQDVVLEVGTGTGSLTAQMASQAAVVVTVEIDPRLFQLASEDLYDVPNVRMLHLDVLKNKNRLQPRVLEAVYEELDAVPGRRFKLVANLPYNIATPLLTNLLALDRPPQSMTVTVQKEVAERFSARPGTKGWGALSIWVQSQCRVEIVRIMPTTAFWPRPKVESAIVEITLDEALRRQIPDRHYFHQFTRSLFCHRRKLLRSELLSAFKHKLEKADVDRILQQRNIEGTVRAEQLDVPTVLALCEAVRSEVGG